MKYIFYLFILLFSISCSEKQDTVPHIEIDLKNSVSSIPYSTFVDSVDYLKLDCQDNFISGVNTIYTDGDFIFLHATSGGIFVFSKNTGSLLKKINYYGKGPGEFSGIEAFTIDRNKKQILICSGPLLHKYTYDGIYIETQDVKDLILDFYPLPDDEYICIHTSYMDDYYPTGVWLADSTLHIIKPIKNDIPSTEVFQTGSTYYNYSDNGIYYYDRVWDDYSLITKDTIQTIYKFDVKQVVPRSERNVPTPRSLIDCVAIAKFAYSERFIILNYYTFDESPSYWVLLDRSNNTTLVTRDLYNDLNDTHAETNFLFYVNDSTWYRVLDPEENNPDLKLEILHVKH